MWICGLEPHCFLAGEWMLIEILKNKEFVRWRKDQTVVYFSNLQYVNASFFAGQNMQENGICPQNSEKPLFALSCLSVRPPIISWHSLTPTGRIFTKCDTWVFFENLSRNFRFHYKLTRITGTLYGDQCTFIFISSSVLLRMRNVSDKSCRENQKAHFVFNNFFLRKSYTFMR